MLDWLFTALDWFETGLTGFVWLMEAANTVLGGLATALSWISGLFG